MAGAEGEMEAVDRRSLAESLSLPALPRPPRALPGEAFHKGGPCPRSTNSAVHHGIARRRVLVPVCNQNARPFWKRRDLE